MLLARSMKVRPVTSVPVSTDFAFSLPALIWVEGKEGNIWSNQAHKDLIHSMGLSKLQLSDFELEKMPLIGAKPVRASLSSDADGQHSFDFEISKHSIDGCPYYFAISIDCMTELEQDRKRSLQQLTDAFTYLPIGVVGFDPNADLFLFNPRSTEMLNIAPSWLAAKPSLQAFLDRLHDKGEIPEPKDFKEWREKILALSKGSEATKYQDDWHLSERRIYRVSGEKFHTGTTIFTFEDISDASSTEREFRAEIRRLFAAFDSVQNGIAVFNSSGELSFANEAFDDIWDCDISKSLLLPDIISVSKLLQSKCEATPIWGDLREFVIQFDGREIWSADFLRLDGTHIKAHFVPLVDGQTLCEFTRAEPLNIPRRSAAESAS